MATPTDITTLIDAFGTNSGPPPTGWAVLDTDDSDFFVATGGVLEQNASGSGSIYNTGSNAKDSSRCTLTTLGSNWYFDLACCLSGGGTGTPSGYLTQWQPDGTIVLKRLDAGSSTDLDTGTSTIANGRLFAIMADSGTLKAYTKAGAGAWSLQASASDSTYTSGYPGFFSYDNAANVWEVDDYYADQVTAGGPTYSLALDAGSYTLTGQAATLKVSRKLALNAGSYTLTGQATTLQVSRKLALDAGSYTITGQAATLQFTRRLALDAGSYTLTGQALTFQVARKLSLDAGAYTLTGQAAALVVARKLSFDAGAYTLTGLAAVLTYTPSGPTYSLALDAGSYVLTGQAASLVVGRKLALDAGAYTLTGNAAALVVERKLALDAGAYTITGLAVAMAVARKMALDAGAYTLTGLAMGMTYSGSAPQIYTVALLCNLSPAASLRSNPSPATSVKSNPSPSVEVKSG